MVEQQQQTLLSILTISKFTGKPPPPPPPISLRLSGPLSRLKSNAVLEQYVEGQPKELIKECLDLDGQNGYTKAMKRLVSREVWRSVENLERLH